MPGLDVPDEFYRSGPRAKELHKRSDYDTRALEAAKCAINRDRKQNEKTMVSDVNENIFTNKGWFYTYIHVTVSLTSRNLSLQEV